RLNSTMVYARVHDQTVAADYYAAMAVIEERLDLPLNQLPDQPTAANGSGQKGLNNGNGRLLTLVDALESETLNGSQRALVAELRQGILALTA
ncbi:MAG: hypothetical protein ACE5EH_13100, partial [Gammaproteobacteria bacterium]